MIKPLKQKYAIKLKICDSLEKQQHGKIELLPLHSEGKHKAELTDLLSWV